MRLEAPSRTADYRQVPEPGKGVKCGDIWNSMPQ